MKRTTAFLLAAWAALAGRAEPAEARGVPLPPAPVRVVIPDVPAFDAALTGAYRRAFLGAPAEDDPLTAAWRRTQVGSKLEDQWSRLSADLPWTWSDILKLKPRSLGLSLFSAGSLEVVVVVDAPLSALVPLPAGAPKKTAAGSSYSLVTRGAGDAAEGDRRMGLAWARSGGFVLMATSEKALLAALEETGAGREWKAPLPGLVSLELDLAALEKDRYFEREFLFGAAGGGRVAAALRLEEGRLLETRQGQGPPEEEALVFDTPGALAAGWDNDGDALFSTLRAALLEPRPDLSPTPVAPLGPLPSAGAAPAEDRYLVDIQKPPLGAGAPWEEGDLKRWRELRAGKAPGWGYRVGGDGVRTLVFPWPAKSMDDLVLACRATLERRGGRVTEQQVGEARELRLGPGLAVLAFRRVGDLVWLGPSAAALADPPPTHREKDVVRWARVDLDALRKHAARWEKVEGPAAPEAVRPFSDRILGLLGWMPGTRSLSVERRLAPGGWTERVTFGTSSPP